MLRQRINRASGAALIVFSITALLAVISGYFQPPQHDEGAAAHVFQLSIAAIAPTILAFLATADWKRPLRNARALFFSTAALAVAFGALYYLEHSDKESRPCGRLHALSKISGRGSADPQGQGSCECSKLARQHCELR